MVEGLVNYTPGRRYPIAYDPRWDHYTPGTLPDGGLAVVGEFEGNVLVGVFFAADGQFLRHEFLPVPYELDPTLKVSERSRIVNENHGQAKRRWMAGLGVTPGTIRVQHFALPELRTGVADWPRHLFNERRGADAEELAEMDREDERHHDWRAGGFFVLYWAGSDFWMKPDGTIGAS